MRLFARSRGLHGSAHSLRSAYTGFALVEPFPNGKLYFKRAVDRPLCVYIVQGKLFILASHLRAFTLTPVGGQRFNLARGDRFFSPGDYLDDDTCLPVDDWSEARAWEAFRLADPPTLDRRDRLSLAAIDQVLGREGDAHIEERFRAEATACLAALESADATSGRDPRPTPPAARDSGLDNECGWGFRGSVDISRRSHAAGWAAHNRESTSVSIFVNGTRVGEARGVGERPDVAAAGFARFSAWSFKFPRPLATDDRAAFRFPDGSPLRLASSAHAPRLGSAHALLAKFNRFQLCELPEGTLRFKRSVDRPAAVYVVDDKLFLLARPTRGFLIEPIAGGAIRLRDADNDRFFSLGSFVDEETCAPEADRVAALDWECFELAEPPPLHEGDRELVEAIDRALLRSGESQPVPREAAVGEDILRACRTLVSRRQRKRAPMVPRNARSGRVGLCAIARNEGPYLLEWAAYHLALGFDQIVIYDNESTDDGFASLEKARFGRDVVVESWPASDGCAQASAYDDFLATKAHDFEWVMLLDVDEFLVLKNASDVKDFLADFDDADGIAVNWRIFGSSDRESWDPGFVVERFVHASRADFGPNANIKSFFRPEAVSRAATHSPCFLDGAVFMDQCRRPVVGASQANALLPEVNFDHAQINHYFTKSLDEFAIKRARGRADIQDGEPGKYRPMSDFTAYDRNEEKDSTILVSHAFLKMKDILTGPKIDLLTADTVYPSSPPAVRKLGG